MKALLLKIHLWIGLILCLPFVILGLTGSVLVYDQDILNWGATVPRASTEPAAAPSAILAAATAARPGLNALMLSMPSDPGDPAVVRMGRAGERGGPGRLGTQLYVDPSSLAILGAREPQSSALVTWSHDLHGRMLFAMPGGRTFVGWLGVGMSLLGFSGLVLWWPRKGQWRRSFGVRRGSRGFLLFRQLHATVGVSTWIVFIVVCLTGVGIAFPNSIGGALGAKPQGPFPRVAAMPGAARIGVDQAVALAMSAAPDTRLMSVFLPGGPMDAYRVSLAATDGLSGAPPVFVTVDPYRARAIAVRDYRSGGAGDAVMLWQRPLHTGDAFGAIGRLLVFVSGLLPTFFVITGISMWLKRRRAPRKRGPILEGAAAE